MRWLHHRNLLFKCIFFNRRVFNFSSSAGRFIRSGNNGNNMITIFNKDIKAGNSKFRRSHKYYFHNPVHMLGNISQPQLEAAAADDAFVAHMNKVYGDFKEYIEGTEPTWCERTAASGMRAACRSR